MSTKILFYSMFVGLVFVCTQSQAGMSEAESGAETSEGERIPEDTIHKKKHRRKKASHRKTDSTDSTKFTDETIQENPHVGPASEPPKIPEFNLSSEDKKSDTPKDTKTPNHNDDGKSLKNDPKDNSDKTTRSWCCCCCPLKVVLGTGAVAIGCYATYRLALYIFKNKIEEEEETDESTEPTTLSTSTTDQMPVSE